MPSDAGSEGDLHNNADLERGARHNAGAAELLRGDAGEFEAASNDVQRTPLVLYLPDGGDVAIGSEFVPSREPAIEREPANGQEPAAEPDASRRARRCPPEMVDVERAFCIDRYEAHLVDRKSGEELSPYYPPDPSRAKRLQSQWEQLRSESPVAAGRNLSLPDLPEIQGHGAVEPMAVSKAQVVPSGYLDANTAERACQNAGKRLCTATEWVTACRGQQNRQFPYGSQYVEGVCNIFREAHPAHVLHGTPSEGHLDPRLNQVSGARGPLLRPTGATTRCKSEWGNDAISDMVGNLDEWVDDPNGAFHGGFYARATKLGCDARISTHPRAYLDYSLGVRCCK